MNEEHHPHSEDTVEGCESTCTTDERLSDAEDALRQARADLRDAQRHYWEMLRAAEQEQEAENPESAENECEIPHHRQIVDSTLALIRKYPGPGVLIAGAVGFLAARLLRK